MSSVSLKFKIKTRRHFQIREGKNAAGRLNGECFAKGGGDL
jgi:hypothetical protein